MVMALCFWFLIGVERGEICSVFSAESKRWTSNPIVLLKVFADTVLLLTRILRTSAQRKNVTALHSAEAKLPAF
jgi:hypothetical protein